MPRSMVGLLAAVGTAMSSLAAFAHGKLVWLAIADAAVATGLAACLALPVIKTSDIPRGMQHIPNGMLPCPAVGPSLPQSRLERATY
jgi:hypothetical protein